MKSSKKDHLLATTTFLDKSYIDLGSKLEINKFVVACLPSLLAGEQAKR